MIRTWQSRPLSKPRFALSGTGLLTKGSSVGAGEEVKLGLTGAMNGAAGGDHSLATASGEGVFFHI